MALNRLLSPTNTRLGGGTMVIEDKTTRGAVTVVVTVNVDDAEIRLPCEFDEREDAVIVVVPVANPFESPAADMDAIEASKELQVTLFVRSPVDSSS